MTQEALTEKLREVGFDEVLLVDDSFQAPDPNQIDAEDISVFLAEVARIDGGNQVLQELGVQAEGAELSAADLRILSEQVGAELIGPACRALLGSWLGARAPLERIESALASVGLQDPRKEPPERKPDEVFSGLLFMDLYLTEDDLQPAIDYTRELAKKAAEANVAAPFVVLMSSDEEALSQYADQFREGADLLAGEFDFVAKTDLGRPEILRMRLQAWVEGHRVRRVVRQFVDALGDRLQSLQTEFRKGIRALSLADYAYIERFALHADGQPLGDYMLWLFSSFAQHLLESDQSVRDAAQALDGHEISNLIPTQRSASRPLGNVYHKAVTRHAGDLGHHPRETDEERRSSQIYLQFGDVLADSNDPPKLYLVANAACDLAWSPRGEREFNSKQAILLIPGELYPLTKKFDSGNPRTDLFQYGEKTYRLVWFPDRVETTPHGEFQTKRAELRRLCRLRSLYALDVQQKFATSSTRVGIPTPPPHAEILRARFYSVDESGVRELLRDDPNGSLLFHRKKGLNYVNEFLLTLDFAQAVAAQLPSPEGFLEQAQARVIATQAAREALEQLDEGERGEPREYRKKVKAAKNANGAAKALAQQLEKRGAACLGVTYWLDRTRKPVEVLVGKCSMLEERLLLVDCGAADPPRGVKFVLELGD